MTVQKERSERCVDEDDDDSNGVSYDELLLRSRVAALVARALPYLIVGTQGTPTTAMRNGSDLIVYHMIYSIMVTA